MAQQRQRSFASAEPDELARRHVLGLAEHLPKELGLVVAFFPLAPLPSVCQKNSGSNAPGEVKFGPC